MATFCEITFSFLAKLLDHTIYIYHTQCTAGFGPSIPQGLDRRALDPRGTGQTAKLFCHADFSVYERMVKLNDLSTIVSWNQNTVSIKNASTSLQIAFYPSNTSE